MGIKSNNPTESYFNYFGASGLDAVNAAPLPSFAGGGGGRGPATTTSWI